MIRGILNAIASVVHHAYHAERLDVSFFVLGDDDGDKQAADYAPTQVDQRLGSGSMRRNARRCLFDLQICSRLLAAVALDLVLNALSFVE